MAFDSIQVRSSGSSAVGTCLNLRNSKWAEMDATDKELAFRQWQETWDEFVDGAVNDDI
jgi:hypothetical protein